ILTNLDVLVNRFRNKNNNVRASTLKVYKSRVKSSVEDFKAWSADPFAWERAVTDKAKAAAAAERGKERLGRKDRKDRTPAKPARAARKGAGALAAMESQLTSAPEIDGGRRVSFPIRPDFSVEMTIP